MQRTLPKSHFPTGLGESEAPGSVYAIVPAHGGSNADSVAKNLSRELSESYRLSVLLADFCPHGFPVWNAAKAPQRLDRRAWGAFLTAGDAFDGLEASQVHPSHISRLLDRARARYDVVFADLSEARESTALEVLRSSDSIFLVANSDAQSIEQTRYRAAWLHSMDLDERAAILLDRVTGGVSGGEAEERTGLPVCAALNPSRGFQHIGEWLAAPALRAQATSVYYQPALRAG